MGHGHSRESTPSTCISTMDNARALNMNDARKLKLNTMDDQLQVDDAWALNTTDNQADHAQALNTMDNGRHLDTQHHRLRVG
jgi:hypothetical protein